MEGNWGSKPPPQQWPQPSPCCLLLLCFLKWKEVQQRHLGQQQAAGSLPTASCQKRERPLWGGGESLKALCISNMKNQRAVKDSSPSRLSNTVPGLRESERLLPSSCRRRQEPLKIRPRFFNAAPALEMQAVGSLKALAFSIVESAGVFQGLGRGNQTSVVFTLEKVRAFRDSRSPHL